MKANRKSTKIAYWVLRVLAISCALLLFSVTGIVALQTVTQATVQAAASDTTTTAPADITPTDPVPTPIPPTNTPIPPPTDTPATLPTPTPKPIPTKTPSKQPTPTPIPTPIPNPTTGIVPTSTPVGGNTLPPGTKGKPQAKPSPTPLGSPTPSPSGTSVPNTSNGNTSNTPKTQPGSDSLTAMIKPLIWPITGVGTTILLSSAGILGLMLWRKRTAGQGAPQRQSSPTQASIPWLNEQAAASNIYYPQPDATAAQKQAMVPFAMQSIAQYSPLLGAPDSAHLDAPVPLPASDFRPLPLDFPHILDADTDKTPIAATPSPQPALPTNADAALSPIYSTPLSPMPYSPDIVSSPLPPTTQTPIPPAQQIASTPYQFPAHDPSLENLMHQAQMGIFALPSKEE